MDSYYDFIKNNPSVISLQVNELLLAEYQCPLSFTRYDIWSHQNYFIYAINGKKKWFTRYQEKLVKEGECIFVRKGAHSVYQYFEKEFCAVVLFVPDSYIKSVLTQNHIALDQGSTLSDKVAIYPLPADTVLDSYFRSFLTYLSGESKPAKPLLELKFKELVLLTASRNYNPALNTYFASICKSEKPSLLEVMEANFQYPLNLKEFARLSARSLSTFKSDFNDEFGMSPAKWLKKKRLNYSKYLLKNTDKPVTEIVLDAGFQNTSHFSRTFKSTFQCSPLAFRKEHSMPG
jgi:AraC family transcriptional regulator, exoenzyme S synthesis regulatory protein ExsA